MKTVRVISKVLLAITRLIALGYFFSFLLSAIALSTGWSLKLVKDKAERFVILYPFTDSRFLLGDYESGYIFMFLLILGSYAFFFWTLGNVFKVFNQVKLFTQKGIGYLKWFYISNLTVPLAATILISVVYEVESPVAEGLIVLHALLGVFTYFIAAIFKQGVSLQNEQDLII